MEKENIVKKISKERGLTYKQLGEKIGYTESAIKTAISTDKISEPMQKAIEMYLKIEELQEKVNIHSNFKKCLKDFLEE
ncbi:MAG: transcriptional regulator [Aliarcobacter sp.]|nr:transcriptional regulator [Aliarcobacter sp.]